MIDRRRLLASSAALAAVGAAGPALAAVQGGEDARLDALLTAQFEDALNRTPEGATSLGLDVGARAAQRGQLADRSVAAYLAEAGRNRERLAQLADSAAVRALQGIPRGVETTGGFVAWDAGWFLALVIGVWSVLATTRLLRGEEDSGRADLVLSRPVRATSLLQAQLAVVSCVCCAFGATVALALVLLGVEALVIAAVLIVLGLVSWAVVRVGLLPLDRMGHTAGAIAGGDLEDIKRKQETLMTASHKLSEVLYSQAQQESGSAETTDADDLVEDAEVVDDEEDTEERR